MKIAVASGKGGTGKTFIATNLFFSLTGQGYNTGLIDCDAEAPNAAAFFNLTEVSRTNVAQLVPVIDTEKCTWCGKCHEYCNYNAIFYLPHIKLINVIEELCHGCGACSFACDSGAISEKPESLGNVVSYSYQNKTIVAEAVMNPGVMSPVPVIKKAISLAGNDREVIIMDSPPGTSCPFIQTVATADYIILVTEPTPFGLSDLKQSVDTLRTIGKDFGVIINRAGLGSKDIYTWLESENIRLLLEVPFKKETARIYSTGSLVADHDRFFMMQLMSVYKHIEEQYGDSSNQR